MFDQSQQFKFGHFWHNDWQRSVNVPHLKSQTSHDLLLWLVVGQSKVQRLFQRDLTNFLTKQQQFHSVDNVLEKLCRVAACMRCWEILISYNDNVLELQIKGNQYEQIALPVFLCCCITFTECEEFCLADALSPFTLHTNDAEQILPPSQPLKQHHSGRWLQTINPLIITAYPFLPRAKPIK